MNSPNQPQVDTRGAGSRCGFNGAMLGMLFVLAGVLLLLSRLFPDDIRWREWSPALLVAWGVMRLIVNGARGWIFSVILVIAGALFWLDRNVRSFDLDFSVVVALVVIGVGISILLRRRGSSSCVSIFRGCDSATNNEESLRVFAILGSHETSPHSSEFRRADISAVLGHAEVNLTGAGIAHSPARINATAIFGSVEIRVPENWEVQLSGTPALGSFEDKRSRPATHQATANAPTLLVDGLALFGSVEIK